MSHETTHFGDPIPSIPQPLCLIVQDEAGMQRILEISASRMIATTQGVLVDRNLYPYRDLQGQAAPIQGLFREGFDQENPDFWERIERCEDPAPLLRVPARNAPVRVFELREVETEEGRRFRGHVASLPPSSELHLTRTPGSG